MSASDRVHTRWTPAESRTGMERVKAEHEKRARDQAAWDRICGPAATLRPAAKLIPAAPCSSDSEPNG